MLGVENVSVNLLLESADVRYDSAQVNGESVEPLTHSSLCTSLRRISLKPSHLLVSLQILCRPLVVCVCVEGYDASVKSVLMSRRCTGRQCSAKTGHPSASAFASAKLVVETKLQPQTLILRVESMVCSMCEGVLEK
jgi:copper chaperone CopZ